MLKISQYLITLPILALPFAGLAAKPALAEAVGLERALELLAKSVVVDGKCNVLTMTERDELSSYVAKAEVAAAEKTSVAVTRSALAAGRNQGLAATCGSGASDEVKETLVAARDAINSSEREDARVAKPALAAPLPAARGSLSNYGRIIETYYLERRCAFLSRRKMNSFYRAVVRSHREVLAKFGRSAVSKVMKSSEARSNYQRCNGAGEARVKAGFAEIASR